MPLESSPSPTQVGHMVSSLGSAWAALAPLRSAVQVPSSGPPGKSLESGLTLDTAVTGSLSDPQC